MEPREDEEELDTSEVIDSLRKINPRTVIILMVLCLLILSMYFGFIVGYNKAYHLQKDYYEEYMIRYCFCREQPNYNVIPASIDELNLNYGGGEDGN